MSEIVSLKTARVVVERRPVRLGTSSLTAAAKELRVSRPTLRKAIELGEVKTITFAGRKMISGPELERLRDLFRGER